MSVLPQSKADLVYNIAEQRLTGVSQSFRGIDFHAVSGGRAGSHHPTVVNSLLANNPFATAVTDPKKRELSSTYGPIPLGRYSMKKHPHHTNWVKLDPLSETYMFGRSGMAIHPRGEIGSHGCIVPDTLVEVLKVLHAISVFLQENTRLPVLEVTAVGDLDRFAPLSRTV